MVTHRQMFAEHLRRVQLQQGALSERDRGLRPGNAVNWGLSTSPPSLDRETGEEVAVEVPGRRLAFSDDISVSLVAPNLNCHSHSLP